ncbi:unnamed protein product [Toxocara canis]|uniref:Complexin n=1 Tax=Toxocara canis TaxID=6265 RepID=A0A183UU62_TOXCA|nr:unnamed protein product [Toxocara canis]
MRASEAFFCKKISTRTDRRKYDAPPVERILPALVKLIINVGSPGANSNELGDLDETPTNNEDSWDTHIDIDDVDDLLKEQRRRERLEKQRARLAEHERRMAEKRSMHLKIVAVVYYLYIL